MQVKTATHSMLHAWNSSATAFPSSKPRKLPKGRAEKCKEKGFSHHQNVHMRAISGS